jgi:DNA-binding Xre family transcriptional regulator
MRNVSDIKIRANKPKLAKLMANNLMDIESLAKATHYSYSQINHVLTYNRNTSLDCARIICQVLECKFEDIFELEN